MNLWLLTPHISRILTGFVGVLITQLPATAETPEVRFWLPFDDASQVFTCLNTDLGQWSDDISEQLGEAIFPHRIISLPEGRYVDQIRAAIDTGEQPHILLLEDTQRPAASILTEGEIFGADLMGVWVDEGALASLPRALTALKGIWTGEAETSLFALDDLLILIAGQGTLPFAIDTGPQGLDVGLSMALLVEQWTQAFVDPSRPDWREPSFGNVLETLTRWQREGLMEEVDLQALRSSAGLMPFLTLGRYSAGNNLGPEFAFYPLFSNIPGQSAKFLELPYRWHVLRSEEAAVIEDVWNAIGETNSAEVKVFETCAETAGLLSRQQLQNEKFQKTTSAEEAASDGQEQEPMRELALFMARASQNFPDELAIGVWSLDPISMDIPAKLADAFRDMRAGLSLQNTLNALEAE